MYELDEHKSNTIGQLLTVYKSNILILTFGDIDSRLNEPERVQRTL